MAKIFTIEELGQLLHKLDRLDPNVAMKFCFAVREGLK